MGSYEMINLYLFIITISYIFGISLSWIIGFDITELQWTNKSSILQQGRQLFCRPDIFFIIISPIFIGYYNNMNITILLLIICGISIILSFSSPKSGGNKIIIAHWIIVLWLTFILQQNPSNIISLFLILLCLDMCSILQISLLPINIPGDGPWYYLLYQSILTFFLWFFLSIDFFHFFGFIFLFWKLGAGIGGFYLPSLYRGLSSLNIYFLLYIGTSNILLMWNCSLLFFSSPLLFSSSSSLLLLFNFLILLFIFFQWTILGNWFINHWLFSLCSSTMITSSISLFISLSSSSFSFSFLGAFLFSTQILWCCIIYCLSLSSSSYLSSSS